MKPKLPPIIVIAVLTLITAVLWILLSVYRIYNNKPPLVVTPEIVEPVTPNLDKNTIEAIVNRLYIEEGSVAVPTTSPSANEQP
jgi:hypothetical protein